MKINIVFVVLVTYFTSIYSQEIKSPKEFLGYELGSRFTRHHKVIEYFNYIASQSQMVQVEKYGETNEHRDLIVAYISSPKNIENLEQIRTKNLTQIGLLNGNATSKTAIVWLSYNVHGNESSSTETSMITLYELITEKKDWLENTLIIMDPCINPDGRDRYVNWYNQVKSAPYNTLQSAKEHDEPWPGGRPNHYLFDLNRDWAWATQVETQQRLKIYNKWMPHIHVDFHEQYINNPYYFAPAAEPFHEVITPWQRNFQTEIGKNHAQYFDKNGWLYFTKESFDLLYPSYGDTYPTFMGAIGMTYEQAGHGMAGLAIETNSGYVLTLKDRILHHKTTGLSTVEMASKNAEKLNTEFVDFFKNNQNLAYKSFVIKNDNEDKVNKLKSLLLKHDIKFENATNQEVKGFVYSKNKEDKLLVNTNDLVIHTDQPKGKMAHVLFEPKAKLTDSLTYDITAWSLPFAYGLEAVASTKKVVSNTTNATNYLQNKVDKKAYGYICAYQSLEDAAFLAALLKENFVPRFTKKEFSIDGKNFEGGTILILRHDNDENFDEKLFNLSLQHGRKLTTVYSGFVSKGLDFGSASVLPIKKQNIVVLSGEGTSSLSFGEVWHFFEKDLQYPTTNINVNQLSTLNLSKVDVLVMPSGNYQTILDGFADDLKNWLRSGGTIIALDNAIHSFVGLDGFEITTKKPEENTNPNLISYKNDEREQVKNLITGSIFEAKVDNSHPLAFGYNSSYFSLKLGNDAFELLKKGNNIAYFDGTSKPISGFAGSKAVKNVPNSLLIGEEKIGRGSVIYVVDNPLFRAFWENGKLFMANASFLLNSSNLNK